MKTFFLCATLALLCAAQAHASGHVEFKVRYYLSVCEEDADGQDGCLGSPLLREETETASFGENDTASAAKTVHLKHQSGAEGDYDLYVGVTKNTRNYYLEAGLKSREAAPRDYQVGFVTLRSFENFESMQVSSGQTPLGQGKRRQATIFISDVKLFP